MICHSRDIFTLTYHRKEEINMRSLVNKKSHRMFVNCHFQYEVGRSAGLDTGPEHAVMVRVDQGLVKIKHQHLLPDHVEAVSGDRREGGDVILDGFVLLNLREIIVTGTSEKQNHGLTALTCFLKIYVRKLQTFATRTKHALTVI